MGVLPVQVSEEFLEQIFKAIKEDPKAEFTVDLPSQSVTLPNGESESFEINGYKKQNMLNGFDDIDYLQNMMPEIEKFAAERPF